MELNVQIECLHGVAVVNCSGRMVRGAALDEFRRRIERLERVHLLVLDLSEVEKLDAGGLGALLLLRRWTNLNCARLKLVNPPAFFLEILQATHLSSVFEISSLKEALWVLRSSDTPRQYAIA
jgi:anti-anti-sigma factor